MSVDPVARALAVQAQPVDALATGIGSVSIPAANKVIRTKGYGLLGRGIAAYVADSQANAALAAAHPRFCKRSADGRYWRLSVEDGLNVLAAGAVADNVANDGPAFVAALAYLKAIALTRAAIGFGKGGPKLLIPSGNYYLGTSTLDIEYSGIVEGDNGSRFSGGGTTLRWADNTAGIRTMYEGTSGASGLGTAGHSSMTIIRNLYLVGGFSATESESHGVQLRSKAVLENVTVDGFGGDGVFGNASVGGGASYLGNVNGSTFINVGAIRCRNGFYFDGFDVNGLTFINCESNSCRRYGAWHKMGININWFGGLLETNGSTTGFVTKCSYGGYWYYCLPNQETGAAGNAPKGSAVTISIASPGVVTWTGHGLPAGTPVRLTTTGALPTGLSASTISSQTTYYVVPIDANTFGLSATPGGAAINTSGSQSGVHTIGAAVNTAYWGHMAGAGYVSANDFPAWTNGMAIRAAGSFRADGVGQQGVLWNPYIEPDQPMPLVEGPWYSPGMALNLFTGATHGGQVTFNTTTPEFGNSLAVRNALTVGGEVYFGRATFGPPVDPTIHLITNNAYATHQFEHLGVPRGQFQYYHGGGLYSSLVEATHGHHFSAGGSPIARIGQSGLLVSFAGARIGYDTGAGGAVTQVTSRTTGVTLNKACGAITLVSAAGSPAWLTFTVTNSVVGANDTVQVSQKSGTDKYLIHVTKVAAGSFELAFATTGGTTIEQPVFSFTVTKGVAS